MTWHLWTENHWAKWNWIICSISSKLNVQSELQNSFVQSSNPNVDQQKWATLCSRARGFASVSYQKFFRKRAGFSLKYHALAAILEACSHVIASSEILTTMFDCDSYPDSLDRNVCEDPTRRGKCYKNEFKCLDSTCIPLQWKCDNIKDCAEGDDEENCKFCETNEFRYENFFLWLINWKRISQTNFPMIFFLSLKVCVQWKVHSG